MHSVIWECKQVEISTMQNKREPLYVLRNARNVSDMHFQSLVQSTYIAIGLWLLQSSAAKL